MDAEWGQDGDRGVVCRGWGVVGHRNRFRVAFSAGRSNRNEVRGKVVIADLLGTRRRSNGVVVHASGGGFSDGGC